MLQRPERLCRDTLQGSLRQTEEGVRNLYPKLDSRVKARMEELGCPDKGLDFLKKIKCLICRILNAIFITLMQGLTLRPTIPRIFQASIFFKKKRNASPVFTELCLHPGTCGRCQCQGSGEETTTIAATATTMATMTTTATALPDDDREPL